jgi:NAD(P)-dependent dehydrogenase (short-subunit alcohol dehydrogenase family)
MRTLEAKVVAITGAGSSIGRALAIACAAEGAEVALADVNEAGLEETRGLLAGARRASVSRVDVADRGALFAWADRVRTEHGAAHVVVNNAGVSLSARVAEMSFEDFDGLFRVNLGGVVAGTQAFLPSFLARPALRARHLTMGFRTTLPSFSATSKSTVRPAYFALSCASVLFSCATTFSYSRLAAAASPRFTRSLT